MADTEHILVVDDEEGFRLQLDEFLSSEGCRVTTVPNGQGLCAVMDEGVVYLVLLDFHLPGEDGITIARDYLSKTDVGVIMLTSRIEVMDRVVGLEVSADDCIPKPYHLRELLARIRSVLRRRSREVRSSDGTGSIPRVRFAGWVLDYLSRSLTSPAGECVPLTSSEFSLLVVFIRNPNRVLSRDELMNLAADRKW